MIAAHHGQPYDCFTNSAVMIPPMPLTKPIDRSISPSSSANTSPIANNMYTAPWINRLTRFPAVRKLELSDWKRIEMRIRPATTGSTPLSPDRMRTYTSCRYSRSVSGWGTSATSVSATAASASSFVAVESSVPVVSVTKPPCGSRHPWS